jgi:hypothetical protein
MHRRISLTLLFAPLLCAQPAVTVEGAVLNHVTHQGISGVSVTLDRGTAGLSYRAVTGADGTFRIANVDAGDYLPIFEKRGLSVVDAPERPIHFDAASSPIRLHAEMISWTRISGHVFDAENHPVPKVQVTLIPMREGRTSSGTVATTDTSGAFIIATQAGVYRLMAAEGDSAAAGSRGSDDAPAPRISKWAPTYYPAATEPQAAQRIAIVSGVDLTGYDIHLQSTTLVKIRGTLLDTRGEALAGIPVKLVLAPSVW